MSFDQVERSNHDSAPTTLYEFTLGPRAWRYTSGDASTTLFAGTSGAQVYDPIAISDGGYAQSGDITNDDLTITMPRQNEFVSLFNGTPPSDAIYLRIRRKNRGQADAPLVWIGNVSNVKVTTAAAAEVLCKMLTTSFDRNGLRLSWGRGCPHALYDRNCRADKSRFAHRITVEALNGSSLTSSGFAAVDNGYFANGFFEWERISQVTERRPIDTHNGNTVSVLGATDGITVGTLLTVYPGCDRTTGTCLGKFNNLDNYGGFPHMPGKSPFDGDPVF